MLSPDQIALSTALQEKLIRLQLELMLELDGNLMLSSSLITVIDIAMNGIISALTGANLTPGNTLLSSRLSQEISMP